MVAAVVSGYAFVHALRQCIYAFTAVGKLTKNAWLGITGSRASWLLIPLFGLLANPVVLLGWRCCSRARAAA